MSDIRTGVEGRWSGVLVFAVEQGHRVANSFPV